MHKYMTITAVAAVVLACVTGTQANVGIETVPVGDVGNSGELSGSGSGGYGPARTCGAVDYPYNIGKYEVTAGQYTEFLNTVAGIDTYGLYNSLMWSNVYGCKIERFDGSGTGGDPYQYRVAVDYANRPVNYVSWGDSARFANWLHNDQPAGAQNQNTTEDGAYFLNGAMTRNQLQAVSREDDWLWAITNEDEWYKAAYHKNDGVTGNYFSFPASGNSMPGRDMSEVTNPGDNANYRGSPFPIDSPHYTTVAGEFELSDSPHGTFDQGGNVWEWTEAIIWDSYRGRRGGSFYETSGAGLEQAMHRYTQTPEFEYYDLGFRVAQVPEPTAIWLLALAGAAMLRPHGVHGCRTGA